MSKAASLGSILFDTETAWAEDVDTFTYRLPIVDRVDVSGLVQAKIDSARTVQRRNEYTMPIRGTKGGSFTVKMHLTGHGSSTSGATAPTVLGRFLGFVFGNNGVSAAVGTVASGVPTATSIPTVAADGFEAGSIAFVGVHGDAGGGGQAAVIDAHATSTATLLTGLPAAPAAGAVVYSAEMVYPSEDDGDVTSGRFRLLTGSQRYDVHGCWPMSVTLGGLNPGELPFVEATIGVSWWEPVDATFPDDTTVDKFNPVPVAAGSVFIQAVGTPDRVTYSVRSLTISYGLGISAKKGPGGVDQFQDTIGAERTPDTITMAITVDAQTASASPTWPGRWASDSQFYQVLVCLNGAASGQRVAFYAPSACLVENSPAQSEANGLNQETINFRFGTGPTTTTDLTASALRIALG